MPKFARTIDQPDLKTKLIRLYCHQGKSLEDIAKIFGFSKTVIHRQMRKFGVRLRSLSQARLLAQKKGKIKGIPYYYLNNRFFKKWSNEMAYVLGLILTDGCISTNLHSVTLAMNDNELLEKVRSVMDSNFPITPSKHQPKLHIYRISRMAIVKDLLRLGITPKKSLTIKFPNVPEQYLSHFIRGVFDGDGSVMIKRCPSAQYPTGAKWLKTSFISGSEKFIVELERRLQFLGMVPRIIYKDRSGKNTSYRICYGGRDSKKLLKIMYMDTENGLYLERKYQIYQTGMLYKSKIERFKLSDSAPEIIKRFFLYHHGNERQMRVEQLADYVGCSRDTIYRLAKTDAKKVKKRYIDRIEAL